MNKTIALLYVCNTVETRVLLGSSVQGCYYSALQAQRDDHLPLHAFLNLSASNNVLKIVGENVLSKENALLDLVSGRV